MKVKNLEVMGFGAAIRGMRNPRMSHDDMDSYGVPYNSVFVLGEKDRKLARKLVCGSGSERKFLRMIHAQFDLEGTIGFWHDFDTYKIATVVNSESRRDYLQKNELTTEKVFGKDCPPYSHEVAYVIYLNNLRKEWLRAESAAKKTLAYNELLSAIPVGYRQLRTIDVNYETLHRMWLERRRHPLIEWRDFCQDLEMFPYAKEFICFTTKKGNNDAET